MLLLLRLGATIPSTLNPCPDEEGIKTRRTIRMLQSISALNPCPDEEGIKTSMRQGHLAEGLSSLNPCPDEEGIKTAGSGIRFLFYPELPLSVSPSFPSEYRNASRAWLLEKPGTVRALVLRDGRVRFWPAHAEHCYA